MLSPRAFVRGNPARVKFAAENITQSAPTQTRFYFQESTSVTKHIRDAIRKDKLQEEYKRHSYLPDISAKARQAKQQAAAKSRYTVIAKKRAIELDGLDCVEGDESNKENEAVAADKKPEADIEEVQLENDDAKYHLYDVIQEDNSDSVVSSSLRIKGRFDVNESMTGKNIFVPASGSL